MSNKKRPPQVIVAYDGQCIFCENYVELQKLRKNAGEVLLVNARDNPEIVLELDRENMDINLGMAVKYRDEWYFGAQAMTLLSRLAEDKRLTGKMFSFLFSNSTITALIYPIFRAIRNLVLKVRGIDKIATGANE